MNGMTIGKYAAAGGVGVETIRYYQRRGLLPLPDRTGGIHRYRDDDLRRLRFIRMAQAAGFTLDEVGALLTLDASHDKARARELALARIVVLDRKLQQMQHARAALTQLAEACANSTSGPCPIIAAFDQSGRGPSRPGQDDGRAQQTD